ncbi:MAG: DinB family protein [Saprospiraceae bacterium]
MENRKLTNILAGLDKDILRIFKFLDQFPNEELNKKPSPDAWSVNQIIFHLILSEQSSIGYVKRRLSNSKGKISKAGAASRLRALLLTTSMKQPIKLKAPEIDSVGIPEKSNFYYLKNKWFAQRKALRDTLDDLNEEILDCETFKHPVAGMMDIWGMLHFFEAHIKRHEKQIKKTIRIVEDFPVNPEEHTMDEQEAIHYPLEQEQTDNI